MKHSTSAARTAPAALESKPQWLARFRRWHKWGGVAAALFLVVVAATGMILNYKRPIFAVLGLESPARQAKSAGAKARSPESPENAAGVLTTAAGFAAGILSLEQALTVARGAWGEVALERIELRADRGQLNYRLRARDGAELQIDAQTGAQLRKAGYEQVKVSADGTTVVRTRDWGKIILDLHTGRIGGEAGKIVMTVAALLLIFLTLSGLYLWLKPVWLRRRNANVGAAPIAPRP